MIATAAAALGFAAGAPRVAKAESPSEFQNLIEVAMERMHAGMHVAPSGDVDRDFARMMVPHHQGAVDMAILELRFGEDLRLRRLAQGIVVEQRQEIQVMQSILDGAAPRAITPRSGEVSAPLAPHPHGH